MLKTCRDSRLGIGQRDATVRFSRFFNATLFARIIGVAVVFLSRAGEWRGACSNPSRVKVVKDFCFFPSNTVPSSPKYQPICRATTLSFSFLIFSPNFPSFEFLKIAVHGKTIRALYRFVVRSNFKDVDPSNVSVQREFDLVSYKFLASFLLEKTR